MGLPRSVFEHYYRELKWHQQRFCTAPISTSSADVSTIALNEVGSSSFHMVAPSSTHNHHHNHQHLNENLHPSEGTYIQCSNYKQIITLCSRKFQNVKLRLDFIEIWSFYCHSDFTWNPILVNSNSPKMTFLAILETQNFEFWSILDLKVTQIY